jgi:hypothetical protein
MTWALIGAAAVAGAVQFALDWAEERDRRREVRTRWTNDLKLWGRRMP